MIAFYHDKDMDMLKLSCTSPNLSNICLHKATDAKVYPIMEGDKDLLKQFEEILLVVHQSFLHAKQLLMNFLYENLQTNANPLLGLRPVNYFPTECVNPYLTVLIRVWFSIQKRVDSYLDKTRPAALKIWSCLLSNEQDQNMKKKASLQHADRKKMTASVLNGFCPHCNTVFEDMGCSYHFCPCQELRPSLTEEDIRRGSKKGELDALRRHYIQEKVYKVTEMWECEWWRLFKITITVKQHIREHFRYRSSCS